MEIENSHYKKVFVYCPPNVITGGPETHHAVVGVINDFGGDAYIYYNNPYANVPDPYKIYNVKVATEIEDSEENLFIVCECYTDMLRKYSKINKAIMFLSLEFFLSNKIDYKAKKWLKKKKLPRILYPFAYLGLRILHKGNVYKVNYDNPKLTITCNGYVNKKFLVDKMGVKEERIGYICGPLNKEFLEGLRIWDNKDNVIAYNPKKGLSFTKNVIDRYSKKYKEEFVPICNMTPEEVHNLLSRAKVYIDFGSHPGPERIPREAVVSNCNIITSTYGSAKYYEDVPIPEQFKFNCDNCDIDEIVELIHDMIINYKNYQKYFDNFKKKVYSQPDIFKQNVLKYFYYRR